MDDRRGERTANEGALPATIARPSAGEPAHIVTEDPDALWVLMPMRD